MECGGVWLGVVGVYDLCLNVSGFLLAGIGSGEGLIEVTGWSEGEFWRECGVWWCVDSGLVL